MSTLSPGSATSGDSTTASAFTIILKPAGSVLGTATVSSSFAATSTGTAGSADFVPGDAITDIATNATAFTIILKPSGGSGSAGGLGVNTALGGVGKKGAKGEQGGSGTNPHLVPSIGILWGAAPSEKGLAPGTMSVQTLTDLETQSGRSMQLVRFARQAVNTTWIPTGSVQDSYIKSGHTLVLTSLFAPFTWTQAAAGSADADLTNRANEIKAMGKPVFISFAPEPDALLQAGTAPGTAADYVAAWQRAVTVFRNQGATNAIFVWITGGVGTNKALWTACYPTDAYVDWVASDPYGSRSTAGGSITPLATVNATFLNWATGEKSGNRSLPMMLGAWGTTEDNSGGAGKKQFMLDSLAYFKATPRIKAVLYRNDSEATGTGSTSTTVFGTTLLSTGGGLAAVQAKYNEPIPAIRFFGGNALPARTAGTLNSIDTKADPSTQAAAITSWAAGLHADDVVSYFHEPEDNIKNNEFTAATYKTKSRLFYNAVKAGNPNVIVELCLMSWTVDPASGRNWTDYYDAAACDAISWDFDGDAPSGSAYPDYTVRLNNVLAIAASTGKPWSVSEFTSAQASWDPNGTTRATWLTTWANRFAANHAARVLLFDFPGVGGQAEPLKSTAEISAWRAVMGGTTGAPPASQFFADTSPLSLQGWQQINVDGYTFGDMTAGGLAATFTLNGSGTGHGLPGTVGVNFTPRVTGKKGGRSGGTFVNTFALATTGQKSNQTTGTTGTVTVGVALVLTPTGQRTTRRGFGQIDVLATVSPTSHVGPGFPGTGTIAVVVALTPDGHASFLIFTPPSVSEGPAGQGPLFRRYRLDRGVTVIAYEDGTFKQVRFAWQGDLQDSSVVEIYQGGHSYTLTSDQADALRNAGYGQYISQG